MRRNGLLGLGIASLLALLAGCEDPFLASGASAKHPAPSASSSMPPGATPTPAPRAVKTLAGGMAGNQDGAAEAARFRWPYGVASGEDGSVIVADRLNHRLRRIQASGEVVHLAGSIDGASGNADGDASTSRFHDPQGVSIGSDGRVYVADTGNHRIRILNTDGSVSTLAGSTEGFADASGASARFSHPSGLGLDSHGDLLVADRDNHRIRRVTPDGDVSTLSGGEAGFVDGPRSAARFNHPQGIYVAPDGFVYVADSNNHAIRMVTPSGEVLTLAGNGTAGFSDGTGANARFRHPVGLTGDDAGNLYVADWGNHRIRRIQTSTGAVTTLAGSDHAGFKDGSLLSARFNFPAGLARSASGSLLIADYGNHRIRSISP